jgi:hypothetical protein
MERPDLFHADLSRANLRGAVLRGADLGRANLSGANLRGAYLSHAHASDANLRGANLTEANLCSASLRRADLNEANLSGARLGGADLTETRLIGTNLENADLTGCNVYGVSAWDLKLTGANQTSLVITPPNESMITVDDLEVAQFIYLLLNNAKIRGIVDTITTKVVLILGRFTPERKAILDAIRNELRKRDLLPVLFDFEKPARRDITETISTLAHMAKFVIADITDAKSIPQELQRIVPDLPSVPIQPLLQEGADEYGMFEHFKRYPWVLAVHRYRDLGDLLVSLSEKVIAPADAKVKELTRP